MERRIENQILCNMHQAVVNRTPSCQNELLNMKKIGNFLDLSRMKYVLPLAGIVPPGLENEVYLPKVTMPFFRAMRYVRPLIVLSISLLMWASLFFGPQHDFELSAYYFVVGSNSACAVIRSIFMLFYRKEVEEVIHTLNYNLLNPMQSNIRQLGAKAKIGQINRIFGACLSVDWGMALYMGIMVPITTQHELIPSALPADRSDPRIFIPLVIYSIVIDTAYLFGQIGFEWLMLTLVRLTTVEMQVLRQQFTAIFSSLRYDENHEPQIRKNLLAMDTYGESDWLPVKDHPAFYKDNIKLLSKALDKCIAHHIETIKLSRTIRKIYGIPIGVTYLFTIVLSTSYILTSQLTTEKSTSLLTTMSFIAMATLYLNSYYGEECITAGCSIVNDALCAHWYLFPIDMQKKLLIVLQMSQRPLCVDAYGLGPLCLATYKSTVQFCYTLMSFLSSTGQ